MIFLAANCSGGTYAPLRRQKPSNFTPLFVAFLNTTINNQTIQQQPRWFCAVPKMFANDTYWTSLASRYASEDLRPLKT